MFRFNRQEVEVLQWAGPQKEREMCTNLQLPFNTLAAERGGVALQVGLPVCLSVCLSDCLYYPLNPDRDL